MNQRTRRRLTILSAGLLTTIGALSPPPVSAQTLTIKDTMAPHDPITRFTQFSTNLSAAVSNPPESTTEATITGPTWNWSGGDGCVHLTSNGSASNGLDSGFPANYGATTGAYSVNVQCTATYTLTDDKGKQTPINVTGNTSVGFFIRVPEFVNTTSPRVNVLYQGNAEDVPPFSEYGHKSTYELQVQDNQDKNPAVKKHQPYGYGLPREDFPLNPKANEDRDGATWGLNYETGVGSTNSDFSDTDYMASPDQPPGNPWYDTLYSIDHQVFHCMELIPPYTPDRSLYVVAGVYSYDKHPVTGQFEPWVADITLNTHFLSNYWGCAVRAFAGNAFPDPPMPLTP